METSPEPTEAVESGVEKEPSSVKEPNWALAYRGFTKDEDSRIFFALPEEEQLQDEFLCALGPSNKRILLQGRMYVFNSHVCFHADIFGYVKKIVVRLPDVVVVKKACTAFIVPNALEIRTNRGKKIFFQSFLQREVAYACIVSQWRRTSGYAKLYLGHSERDLLRSAPDSDRGKQGPESTAKESLTSESWPDESLSGRSLRPESGPLADAQSDTDTADEDPRTRASLAGSTSDSDTEPAVRVLSFARGGMWGIMLQKANEGTPPAVSRGMSVLAVRTINCNLETYVEDIMSNSSEFSASYHTVRRDVDVQVGRWKEYFPIGYARVLSFRSPVRSVLGPETTRIQESQRCKLFDGGRHLVLEAAQHMLDIPYGDYFRIDTRFDIVETRGARHLSPKSEILVEEFPSPLRDDGPSSDVARTDPPANTCGEDLVACTITISMDVVFEKSTMFRSMIEQGVMEETRESYDLMLDLASRQLSGDVSWVPDKPLTLPVLTGDVVEEESDDLMSEPVERIKIEELEGKIPLKYRTTIMSVLGSEDSQGELFRSNNSSDNDTSPQSMPAPLVDGNYQNGGVRSRFRRNHHRPLSDKSARTFSQRLFPGLTRSDETQIVRVSSVLGKSVRAFIRGFIGGGRRKISRLTGKDLLLVALVFLLISSAAREFFMQSRISKLEEELGHLRRAPSAQ